MVGRRREDLRFANRTSGGPTGRAFTVKVSTTPIGAVPNVFRFHTRPIDGDPRAARLVADAHALGVTALQSVAIIDLTFVLGDLDDDACDRLAAGLLAAPLLATAGPDDSPSSPIRSPRSWC